MVQVLMVLGAGVPVRDPDDAAHVLCGARVEQPQAEHRVGLVRETQRGPGVLLLQRRFMLLDERVVGCQGDDGGVCCLESYQPLLLLLEGE
jgi:hypothetical protein